MLLKTHPIELGQESEPAAQSDSLEAHDRGSFADHRHAAEIAVSKRSEGPFSLDSALDRSRCVDPLLHGDLGHARQAIELALCRRVDVDSLSGD